MKKKKIIIIILILIVIVTLVLLYINSHEKKETNESLSNVTETDEILYEYKAFIPTFENNYDFTQDMIYQDKIYYKKINTYEEYKEINEKWDIIEMTEEDFKDNFMLITAVENTSMLGLTVDKIEADEDSLYISLIHYDDGETYNEDETCISYKISRKLERDNLYVTSNLLDSEKDMSEETQTAETENFINLNTDIFLTDIKNYNPESNDILITEDKAKEIAQYGFEESALRIASEGADNIESETIRIDKVFPNNYFNSNATEYYANIKRTCYVVTRENEMGNGISIYVDCATGLIIGGKAFGD